MHALRSALLTIVALVAAAPLGAQIPIRLGQSLTGRLIVTDQKFSDGSRYKLYGFLGKKGDSVTFDLTSDDFDAELVLSDANNNTLARNDDGGGTCNARLTFVPPATANYLVYANSSAKAELGDYKISVARGHSRAPADTTCRGFGRVAGMINVGETVTGNLSADDPQFPGDSTYFQRWIIPVKAFTAFTVDLESADFDAYLLLTHGRGDKLVDNDDGGGGCNARLVYTPQDDHPLRIIVNTASTPHYQTGHYTLHVTDGSLSTEPKSNCRMSSLAQRTTTPTVQPASAASRTSGAATTNIQVGETVNGALTSADSIFPDTTYFKVYWFSPPAGRDVTIDLSSDEFDPMLIIGGGDLDRPIVNDDGGPGCSSRVVHAFSGRGPYRIRVNTTTEPHLQTGNYTLSITEGAKPVQERGNSDCQPPRGTGGAQTGRSSGSASRSITVGQSQQGSLSRDDVLLTHDSTYAQSWTIQGSAGTTVTIDLESDAFDSYLFLRGPGISGGRDFQDDDSGGNCHARLTATFPQTAEYEIVVNTADHYATGAFTLSVTSGSKPKSVARCNRTQ